MPLRTPAGPLPAFVFVGGRLWLDFLNTYDARLGAPADTIASFERFVDWLMAAHVVDAERAAALQRRATEQPSGAAAALVETRRVREALRLLADPPRDHTAQRARDTAVQEINRVLGRSVGTRRIDALANRAYARSFVPVGDAFGGLIIPVVESAVDSLVRGELTQVRACADRRCTRVFVDDTKSHSRRWCEMATCGNRAKAARLRKARQGA